MKQKFHLYETFDLEKGESFSFSSSHDCELLFLSELEYARWKRTGEPDPAEYTWMPLTMTATSAGRWHLMVNFLNSSSMGEIDDEPTFSIRR